MELGVLGGGVLAVAILVWLIIKHKKSEQYRLRKKLKKESVNFDNVIHNAFHSKELYDALKKTCHPDRFADDTRKVEKATEIFALIAANKYNIQELLKLKERAEKELHINIQVTNQ